MVPLLNYYINYNYIVANLCENVDKPEMQCNGQCHLMKMVKQENQEENNQSPKFPKVELNNLQFNTNIQNNVLKVIDVLKKDKHYFNSTLVPQKIILRIFRPPTFA
ncbi:MAG: hypothetical protein HQ471_02405 [Flavobacteriales bacterium]|jgi:hypothetical protein|nr:hypothetical protein [Flavobacteriales bacterium]